MAPAETKTEDRHMLGFGGGGAIMHGRTAVHGNATTNERERERRIDRTVNVFSTAFLLFINFSSFSSLLFVFSPCFQPTHTTNSLTAPSCHPDPVDGGKSLFLPHHPV